MTQTQRARTRIPLAANAFGELVLWRVPERVAGSAHEFNLAELCERYWYPIYAFIRSAGRDREDASDLTQAFFEKMLERDAFSHARPERGRFRTFLLASVRNFLAGEHERARALKRGGGLTLLPLEVGAGEARYLREPVDGTTPEHIYERRWAVTVLEQALDRVVAEYERTGRGEGLARVKPYLTGDEPDSYAALATATGQSEGALRVAVHRARQRFAEALHNVVAETVETPEEVGGEIRYLVAAMRGRE